MTRGNLILLDNQLHIGISQIIKFQEDKNIINKNSKVTSGYSHSFNKTLSNRYEEIRKKWILYLKPLIGLKGDSFMPLIIKEYETEVPQFIISFTQLLAILSLIRINSINFHSTRS